MSTVNFDGATNNDSTIKDERKAFNLDQLSEYADDIMLGQLPYHIYESKSGAFPPVPGQHVVKMAYQVSGNSTFNGISNYGIGGSGVIWDGGVYTITITETKSLRATNTDSDSSIMNKINTQIKNQLTKVISSTDTSVLTLTDAQKSAITTMIEGTDGTDVIIQYFIDGKPHTKSQMIAAWKAGKCKNKFAYVKNAGDKLIKEIKVAVNSGGGSYISGKSLYHTRQNFSDARKLDFLNSLSSGGKPVRCSRLNSNMGCVSKKVLQEVYEISGDNTGVYDYKHGEVTLSVVIPELFGYDNNIIYRPSGATVSMIDLSVSRNQFSEIIKYIGSLTVMIREIGTANKPKPLSDVGLPSSLCFNILDDGTTITGTNISKSVLLLAGRKYDYMLAPQLKAEYQLSNSIRFVEIKFPASVNVQIPLTNLSGILDSILLYVDDKSTDIDSNTHRGMDWACAEPVVRHYLIDTACSIKNMPGTTAAASNMYPMHTMGSASYIVDIDPKVSITIGSDNVIGTYSDIENKVQTTFLENGQATKTGWVFPFGRSLVGDPKVPFSNVVPKNRSSVTLKVVSKPSFGTFITNAKNSGKTVDFVVVCKMVNRLFTDHEGKITLHY